MPHPLTLLLRPRMPWEKSRREVPSNSAANAVGEEKYPLAADSSPEEYSNPNVFIEVCALFPTTYFLSSVETCERSSCLLEHIYNDAFLMISSCPLVAAELAANGHDKMN
ncbi:hypothetical protein NPIL_539711 [Nephila pilipes]|uniref:Uncharacterized protein n=1 Tax=Nephila pilipes TaxID=299642 RepID=A0A8X6NVE5_NEPPI|nr:hypothetical protein NPIL_539711 [Nephila pilipes]